MIKHDYHHGNLKNELISIAMEFINKEDVDKLTLKILSDATNTSRSAIYKHFKNKDALIETIIQKGFDKFDDETTIYLRDEKKALVDKFYLTGKLYIKFAKTNPNLYRLLFGKRYAHIREELLSIKDEDCSGFAILKKTVEDGQRQGILKKGDSYKQSIVIWSSLHGFSSLIIDGFMDVEDVYEDVYTSIFETLLSGMVADKVKIISTIPLLKKLLQPKK